MQMTREMEEMEVMEFVVERLVYNNMMVPMSQIIWINTIMGCFKRMYNQANEIEVLQTSGILGSTETNYRNSWGLYIMGVFPNDVAKRVWGRRCD